MRAQVAERDVRLGAPLAVQAAGAGVAGPGASAPEPASPFRPAPGSGQARCSAVAVVSGDGLRQMFHELGVHTIDGGPTLNPSTYDLLAGIHDVPTEEVVVLPNSANVILAAEHAARLSEKQVLVAPTTDQQAGLAAAVALAPDRSVEENAQALTEALSARAHRRGRTRRAR